MSVRRRTDVSSFDISILPEGVVLFLCRGLSATVRGLGRVLSPTSSTGLPGRSRKSRSVNAAEGANLALLTREKVSQALALPAARYSRCAFGLSAPPAHCLL